MQASYFSWLSSTQPAVDWELRDQHDVAMHHWAQHRPERPILIAGHTHRPVLVNGKPAPDRTYNEVLAELESRPDDDPDRPALEWELAETLRHDPASTHFDHPCYFNTGCGCLGDGDITAIEMTAGESPELVLCAGQARSSGESWTRPHSATCWTGWPGVPEHPQHPQQCDAGEHDDHQLSLALDQGTWTSRHGLL